MPTPKQPGLLSLAVPIKIRDLLGFNAVEDAALLYGGGRLEQAAAHFTKRHFDLHVEDLDHFRPSDDTLIDPEQLDHELQRHPRRILVDYLGDDETVMFLLSLGFDLRCERGCRCDPQQRSLFRWKRLLVDSLARCRTSRKSRSEPSKRGSLRTPPRSQRRNEPSRVKPGR